MVEGDWLVMIPNERLNFFLIFHYILSPNGLNALIGETNNENDES